MDSLQTSAQTRNSNPQRGGQASLTHAAVRAIYGNARPAFAAASRALRAHREGQPKPPTCRFAPGEALPVFGQPLQARQTTALPASTCQNARRLPAFHEEAQAEYEAHMAEIAEARSHQLDAEMDRYACSFAGAGYAEYLMAMES